LSFNAKSNVRKIISPWHGVAEIELKRRFAIDFDDSGLAIDELRDYASAFEEPRELVIWLGKSMT